MRMPGFKAQRSLATAAILEPDFVAGRRDRTYDFENNLHGSRLVLPAEESEPGGPGTVPSGYGRDCARVSYTVCAGNRCWTEYGWVCTYYPLPRA
jgi:hypothetical protein